MSGVKHRVAPRARRKRKARKGTQGQAADVIAGDPYIGQSPDSPESRWGGDGAFFPHFPTGKVAKDAPVANSATFATARGVRPSRAMVADVTELNRRIAGNVRRARQQAGITQAELGERMGVRRNEVNAYENGRRTITPNVLVRAAQALKRDPAWFTVPHGTDTP